MGDDDVTPIETPLPDKVKRLEQLSTERPMSQQRFCPDHSGLVTEIQNLKEDIVEERKRRETAFTALLGKVDQTAAEVGKLKVDMAKLLGGIGVAIFLLQIALKFIPTGGN